MTLVVQHRRKGSSDFSNMRTNNLARPQLRGTAHGHPVAASVSFWVEEVGHQVRPSSPRRGKNYSRRWGPPVPRDSGVYLWEGGFQPAPVALSASSLPCQSVPGQWTRQGLCPPTVEILINLRRGCMLVEGLCRSGPLSGALWHRGRGR